ncbi:MAG: transporter substrate-binding domain-containing protein [Clostridiales bacterium]|nr:transporter substrate-binding domain-containing protein [Clostridiales bacterium]
MKKNAKIICILLTLVLLAAGCSEGSSKAPPAMITRLEDLEGKIVTTVSTPQDPAMLQALAEQETGVKFKEMLFYDTASAVVAALKSNKADAVLAFGPILEFYPARDAELKAIKLPAMGKTSLHMALRSTDAQLRDQINAALIFMKDNGVLAGLEREFITDLTPDKQLAGRDMPEFDGKPTLIVGLSGDAPPVDYVAADGKPAGYNVELLALLSEMLQVNFEISVIPLESKFPALASNKIDLFFLHAVNADVEFTLKTLENNNSATLTEAYYEFSDWGYLVLR